MTRDDAREPEEVDRPVGSDPEDRESADRVHGDEDADRAPEDPDAGAVIADAAASADEQALDDAGLPRSGAGGATGRRSIGLAGLGHRLYNGEAGLDVVGRSRLIYKITAVVVLLCVASMAFRGFNFGIDFAGGNSFRLPGSEQQLSDVRAAAEDAGADVATAQIVGGDTVLLRTGSLDNDTERAVVEAVADAAGIEPRQVSPESVSAAWAPI